MLLSSAWHRGDPLASQRYIGRSFPLSGIIMYDMIGARKELGP